MKKYAICSVSAALCVSLSLLTGCASGSSGEQEKKYSADEIVTFTGFFNSRTPSISEDNTAKQLIAEKIGAKCDETWLTDDTELEEIVNDMLVSGNYPDFVYVGNEYYPKLRNANALVPIDNYLDDYPHLKGMYTEQEWNRVRDEDGHIYSIPLFSKAYQHDTNCIHGDEAFWVQVKVLQWAGYPKITTLDEYFDLLERYIAENPTNENGEPHIAYEVLASEDCFFCLDNPPQFLAGYPNDGVCIVDPETLTATDYNISDTAKKWFSKLNEEYHKGIIDPESFTQNRDQYREKIRQGNILGFADQRWNFINATENLPESSEYVPLGVVMEEGIREQYHSQVAFNDSAGLNITVSCNDIAGAMKFLDDLVSPEIHTLRFWGVEGKDYSKDENGLFYFTEEQSKNQKDPEYLRKNRCEYGYLPFYYGLDQDGINAYAPSVQPSEFYKLQSDTMKECFDAYGVQTFVELLNQAEENPAWYPMWAYANTFPETTPHGKAFKDIEALKHKYLPRLVMTDDFESVWAEYLAAYSECHPEYLFDELTAEVRRRSGAE